MSFIPRPDWYFYFLFYLLRIFEWPATVVLATVGIPTILMMLLFAVPFIDRSVGAPSSRRPVAIVTTVLTAIAMGVLTWKRRDDGGGSLAAGAILSPGVGAEQSPAERARAGAEIFAASGLSHCHTYTELRVLVASALPTSPRRA